MRSWRWILALVVCGGVAAQGCAAEKKRNSSDDDGSASSSNSANSSSSAGGGSSSTTPTSSPASGPTSGPTSSSTGTGCYDPQAALIAPGDTTVAGQGLCTPTETDTFFSACLGSTGSEQACTDFQTNSAGCFDCILGIEDTTTSPSLLLTQDNSVVVNIMACQAAQMGMPQCGPPASQYLFCLQTACLGCADDTSFQGCLDEAAADICTNVSVPTECEAVLGVEQLDPACDGSDFEQTYTNVTNTLCG